MTTRFSPSTGSFYPHDIDYGANLPADVIEVSKADFDAAMARPAGSSFKFLADGSLTIVPAPIVPFSTIAEGYLNEVRTTRESLLNRIAGMGFAAVAAADQPTITAIAVARQALLDITKAPTVLAAKDLPTLKAAVLAEYRRIVGMVPPAVQKAFAGVDA